MASDAPEESVSDDAGSGGSDRRVWWHGPLLVSLICVAFYLPGIRWGLPGTASWSQDTIAGMRTLGPVEHWPQEWAGRYPPLHYFVLRIAYEPVLRYWDARGERYVDPATRRPILSPPHAQKLGLLYLLARVVSVLMAAGAGLGLWAAARAFGLGLAASAVAVSALMTGAAFSYFARLGNVDIPSICWFTWSLYFYARLLATGRTRDALLLGLFGALAISTKDAVAGMYPGMAVVLLISEIRTRRAAGSERPVGATLWQRKWLVGVAAFLVPYAFLYAVWLDPSAYIERMKYWLDPPTWTLHAGQLRYDGQIDLLLACVRYGAAAVGWPLLVAMIAAAGYTVWRRPRPALALLIPIAGYYLIVLMPIRFVYSRFLIAPIAAGSILFGAALIDVMHRLPRPKPIRAILPAVIFVPTIMYAWSINAEMLTDSRYQAEAWFQENVPQSASVGAFSKQQYLPRLLEIGYQTYAVEMNRESFERPQPEYLILSSYNYEDFDDTQRDCMDALVNGELGYSRIATFEGRFLGAGRSWLSLAGWGTPTPGKISPTLIVMKRMESTPKSQ